MGIEDSLDAVVDMAVSGARRVDVELRYSRSADLRQCLGPLEMQGSRDGAQDEHLGGEVPTLRRPFQCRADRHGRCGQLGNKGVGF